MINLQIEKNVWFNASTDVEIVLRLLANELLLVGNRFHQQ